MLSNPPELIIPMRLLAAGVTANVAFLGAVMAYYDPDRRRCHRSFAVMCLIATAELLVHAQLNATAGAADAARLMQWQYAWVLAVWPPLFYFIARYTEQAETRVRQALVSAASAVLILVNFSVTPYSLRHLSLEPAPPLVLPWGERLPWFNGPPSVWDFIGRAGAMLVVLWALARARILYRRGRRREAALLAGGLTMMGLAVIVGLLIDLGFLALPHAGAMSFLGLIVFMNVALALEAQDRNRALKASSIELQQKIAQIYRTKDRLRKMAYHDFVTGLPNRAKLQEMLSECAAHKSGKGALILLDLDDFRTINDVLGHDFGDRLLRAIAARLLELEQAGGRSHLLHVGGDEFVVLLPEAHADVAAAELEAQRLTRHNLAALNAPFLINGHSLTISASAGIALFPDGDESQGELLQRASMALQRAKSLGRGSIQLYAAEMRREVRERLQLERDIPAGLERGEFIMHFQPQVDFAGEIVGAEALLRWRHPQHGWISPAQFVDVAEQSGLITQMDDWALQHACRQIKAWEQSLPSFSGHVSVNVSAWQFQRSDFREAVRRHLRASDIDPSRLTLEITETAFLRDLDRAVATIKSLKSDGVRFSIDDFGTGYASLSYLGRLPVDELKIDQSFIRKLGSDMRDTHLVETIINIGRCLDLRVVAEGVESDSQKSTLRALHCWALQGYYLARSMTAEAFADWLRQYQRKTSYQASHLHGKPRA